MNQLRKDFYIPGVKHECRFCGTPLAVVKEGLLRPLASKAHFTIVTENGIIHRFNGCKQCAKTDFSNNEILQQVWEDDVDMWRKMEIMEGLDIESAEQKALTLKQEKVILDFCAVELELKQGEAVLEKAKKRLEKFKKGKN